MIDERESPVPPPRAGEENAAAVDRRGFLGHAASVAMVGGLAASYGTFAAVAGRFLYPPGGAAAGWMFLAEASSLKAGDSFIYRAPSGAGIAVARVGSAGTSEDFLALSSTCPHLGCQVHWEPQNDRFFCPCHNGTFDATGKATGGPPAAAGQSLPSYPLKLEEGLLFILVPLGGVASAARPGARGGESA
jgi:Rieske Fe-S protein